MDPLDQLFACLAASPFRRRFHLNAKDRAYLERKGRGLILDHARAFIAERLAPAHPNDDGRQTPMRGHPVFVAQHATATCCRGCLQTWHGIARGRALTRTEQEHVVATIARWITEEALRGACPAPHPVLDLPPPPVTPKPARRRKTTPPSRCAATPDMFADYLTRVADGLDPR